MAALSTSAIAHSGASVEGGGSSFAGGGGGGGGGGRGCCAVVAASAVEEEAALTWVGCRFASTVRSSSRTGSPGDVAISSRRTSRAASSPLLHGIPLMESSSIAGSTPARAAKLPTSTA